MLKIGVIGADNLARIHIQLILGLKDQFDLVGFYDDDDVIASEVEELFKIKRFLNYETLLEAVHCVDIVTPAVRHYELAAIALRKSKHIFIEKPITQSVEEAKSLLNLSTEASVKVQVGSIKRFNPAFSASIELVRRPMLIESRHLIQFNSNARENFSVMELLMHDLDVVLTVAKSGIRKISASGVSVFTDTIDVVNVRLEFDNDCVALLTAGRVVQENCNDVHIYQKEACINVDFLKNKVKVVRLGSKGSAFSNLAADTPSVTNYNPIQEEMRSFYSSILHDKNPIISLEEGCDSLIVGSKIMEILSSRNVVINDNN
jgi:predicted dehydrogenase